MAQLSLTNGSVVHKLPFPQEGNFALLARVSDYVMMDGTLVRDRPLAVAGNRTTFTFTWRDLTENELTTIINCWLQLLDQSAWTLTTPDGETYGNMRLDPDRRQLMVDHAAAYDAVVYYSTQLVLTNL